MENLLSYQGNAGLGLGSNPGISAPDNVPLTQIANTARDLQLQNNQKNVLEWQQKQKDQAILRDAIDSGQVAMGEILPEYQPVFDAAKKQVEDFYAKNGDQLTKDTNKYREYQGLVRNLKDVATHGQVNTKAIKELQGLEANETLPNRKAKITDFLNKQKASAAKDFWSAVTPYQKLHDWNIADINEIPETAIKKTVTTDPNNPLQTYDNTVLDYGEILKSKYNNYLNPDGEKADSFNQWYRALQSHDPIELGKTLSNLDLQLDKYNKARGLKSGMDGFAEPIKREIMGGRLVMKEPVVDMAAKWALANQPEFKTSTLGKFNDKLGSYQIAKERADTDREYKRMMAGTSRERANAYGRYINQKLSSIKKPEEKDNFVNEMYDKIATNQASLIQAGGVNRWGFKNFKADETLPIYTLDGKKPIKLLPKDGEYIPEYRKDGNLLTPKAVQELYIKFKENAGSDWKGGVDDFLKESIRRKRIDFTIRGQGQVDRSLNTGAQRAISNADTDKGETGIFAPPEDTPIPDTPNPIE